MSDPLSDFAVVRALVRGRLLSPEKLWTLLEEGPPRPLVDVLRERGLADDARLLDYMPTQMPDAAPSAGTVVLKASDAAPPPDPEPSPKPRFGKFELIEKLGQGGMGEVWKAWQLDLGRAVALKLLVKVGEADLARSRREAKLSASLVHPNIAAVYEVGEASGRPYLAMELIRGQTLAGLRLPPRRVLEIARDVAEAVHYAHTRGIVHRDIKPHNLMIDVHGKAYVMDFGLARAAHEADAATLTADGAIMGTPSYMAPEQVRGMARAVDPRTDVWALGATLYQLLTGSPPFSALSTSDLFARILRDEPAAPRRLAPGLDRDVETIVLRCLEKDPARRYPSASELAADLNRVLRGEPILARRTGVVERIQRRLSRHPGVLTALALAGLAALPLPLILGAKPDPAASLRARIREAEKTGESGTALALYEELKNLAPEDKDLTPAERAARESAQARARSADAAELVALARRLSSSSRDHAIALFAMATGVDPRDRAARRGLAELLPPGPAAHHLGDPDEGEARLAVDVDPPDARVSLTPEAALPLLKAGAYVVRASKPGFAEAAIGITLRDEGRMSIRLRLPPGQPPPGFEFVSDGRGGGCWMSSRPVDKLGRAEALAYAASKGARLPTRLELSRAAGLWPEAERRVQSGEWSADGPAEGSRTFRLVKDLP